MIIDRAVFLTSAIQEADAAGSAHTRQAALAQVADKLTVSRGTLTRFVVIGEAWRDHISEDARATLRTRAAALADALRPLRGMSDDELTVIGLNTDEANRGALGRIEQLTQNLRAALCNAQDDVMRAWAERVWPTAKLSRLDVLCVIPASADSAREIKQIREALGDNVDIDRPLSGDELRRLEARTDSAEQQARALENEVLPDDVAEFWSAVEAGTPLSSLSVDVLSWLIAHDAAGLFRVCVA